MEEIKVETIVVEQDPPIEQEYLDAIAENMAAEPFIETKEPEYEPKEEQIVESQL